MHLPSPDNFPAELRAIPQWMVYRLVPKAKGGFDKKPVDDGWPDSRMTFDHAYARAARARALRLGFHFAGDADVGGLDIDSCRFPDGRLTDWAKPWLATFAGAYAEVSPSGTGVKIIARGCHATGRRSIPGIQAEPMPGHVSAAITVYGRGRHFFALTGELVPGAALAIPEAVDAWRRVRASLPPETNVRPDQPEGDDRHFGVLARTPAGMRYFENRILGALDPQAFRDHEQWFRLMCACWHVTAGEGEDAFVHWSTSDPPFAGDGPKIRKRWRSLGRRRGNPIGVGTLIGLMLDSGAREEAADFMSRLGMIEDEDAMEVQMRTMSEADVRSV
jgi:hypothetical protein